LAVLQAAKLELSNFSLLVAHVRVQPAMEAIMNAEDCRVEGFLAAGHVCTVAGYESYDAFVYKYKVPVVVTGFEPLDLLSGIRACVRQLEGGQPAVENCYPRSARSQGNTIARDIVQQAYEPCDRPWRGIGVLSNGGLALRPEWSRFDAGQRFGAPKLSVIDTSECHSGDVLSGRIKPPQCPSFGNRCTPEHPLGAPMVSSEGACAAYYRYREIASSPVCNV
jgi:hydrogenase expression/formation protein HypD